MRNHIDADFIRYQIVTGIDFGRFFAAKCHRIKTSLVKNACFVNRNRFQSAVVVKS